VVHDYSGADESDPRHEPLDGSAQRVGGAIRYREHKYDHQCASDRHERVGAKARWLVVKIPIDPQDRSGQERCADA
jgi:hypothetical protein